MRLNIALLPSLRHREELGSIARAVCARFQTKFVVDNRALIPHVTLYQLNIEDGILEEIKRIVGTFRFRTLSATLLEPGGGRNFTFDYNIAKTFQLREMQCTVLDALSHFRSGNLVLNPSSELERRYVDSYGVKSILQLYRPHFTLGAAETEEERERIKAHLNSCLVEPIQFSSVAVTEIDEYGQVFKIHAEFPLAAA